MLCIFNFYKEWCWSGSKSVFVHVFMYPYRKYMWRRSSQPDKNVKRATLLCEIMGRESIYFECLCVYKIATMMAASTENMIENLHITVSSWVYAAGATTTNPHCTLLRDEGNKWILYNCVTLYILCKYIM